MATRYIVSRRILVVDDDPFVTECVKGMLDLDGHEVVTVLSGHEALDLLEKQSFELVITDYDMPFMRGDELAVAIKARWPNQPVAMFTGYGSAVPVAAVHSSPVDLVLAKPFDLRELRAAVAQLVTHA